MFSTVFCRFAAHSVTLWCLFKQLFLQLCEDWNIDAPSYKFTKLDVDNPEDKKKISDYLKQEEGDLMNHGFNQGKIFK